MSDDVRVGQVVRVDEQGARFIPWQQATTIGEVGVSTKIKRGNHLAVDFTPPPIVKTSDREKAERFTQMLAVQLEQMKQALGRDVTSFDLSDQWCRALGVTMWKEGVPITPERLREIAETYLRAAKSGATKDPRFQPAGA